MRATAVFLLMVLAACSSAPAPTFVAAVPIRLLNFWTVETDTLTPQDPARDWQFIGRIGDAIHLEVNTENPEALSVTLRNSAVLAEGSPIDLELTGEGTYTLRVQLTGDSPVTYTAGLSYTNRPTPTVPTATPTETLTPTETMSPTFTQTPTDTLTPTFTTTASHTHTPTFTLTPSITPTASDTPTPVYAPLGSLVGSLTSGTPISGTFISSFERHIYHFDARAGQYATLRMTCATGVCPDGGVDPRMTLYDANGGLMAMDDDTAGDGGALLRNILLPADGVYYVQALSSGSAGDYQLTITLEDAAAQIAFAATVTPTHTPIIGTATPLPGGEQLYDHVPVAGRIERAGSFARYFINAAPAEVVTIAVSPAPGSALQPHVQIINPAGEVLFDVPARWDNGGDALVPALSLLEGGVYSVFVTGDGRTTGDFIVSYGRGGSHRDVQRGEALPGVPNTGEIGRRGLRDVWTVLLNQGDEIALRVQSQNRGFDPTLDIVQPDGSVLASDDNGADNLNPRIEGLRVPVTGLYAIRVSGANAGSYGPYQLVWQRTTAAPTATPLMAAYRILTADDLLPAQSYLSYPFQGMAGQHVRIRITALSADLDPVAALIAPDGTVVAEGDDSGGSLNPDFEAALPATGTYLVRVNAYNGAGGTVTVVVEGLQ